MKIRKGFVSNSSSSSFVVSFPKDIEMTEEAIHKYVFGDKPTTLSCYGSDYISSLDAAHRILSDIQNQTPNNVEAIKSIFSYMDSPEAPKMEDYIDFKDKSDQVAQWEKYHAAMDEFSEKHSTKLLEQTKKEFEDIYIFEYSDNSGEAALEHGGTFDKIKHIRISNH